MSLNKVMLIGNVGKDPEVRYLDTTTSSNNSKVATFPLATSERYRDRNGEVHENTEWHNIVAWRGLADVIERFVKKGTQLFIEGRIRSRSWTDQSGNKRYITEIVVDNLQILSRRADNQGSNQENQSSNQENERQGSSYQNYGSQQQNNTQKEPINPFEVSNDTTDDDLPF